MSFKHTEKQSEAITEAAEWAASGASGQFVLHGSAGSGKSTTTKAILDEFDRLDISYLLVSPTGKAARVLSAKTGRKAQTIHGACYGAWRYEFEADVVHDGEQSKFTHITLARMSGGYAPPTEKDVFRWLHKNGYQVLNMQGESVCRVTPACALKDDSYIKAAELDGIICSFDRIQHQQIFLEASGIEELEQFTREKHAEKLAHAKKLFLDEPVKPWADVIVVDEACMVGRIETEILNGYGVGLLLVGDPYQLPPVGADDPFLAPEGTATVELDSVQRADDDKPDLLEAYAHFRESSNLRDGWETPNVKVRNIDAAGYDDMFGASVILCATNADAQGVNATYRQTMGFLGQPPQVGERVIVTRNVDKQNGVVNGSMFYVADCYELSRGNFHIEGVAAEYVEERLGIDSPIEVQPLFAELLETLIEEDKAEKKRAKELDVPVKFQRVLTIKGHNHESGFDCEAMATDKSFLKKAMRLSDMHFAYGITVHKAQGSEFNNVVFYEQTYWPKRNEQEEINYRRLVYTAMTRGKSSVKAFTRRCRNYGCETSGKKTEMVL